MLRTSPGDPVMKTRRNINKVLAQADAALSSPRDFPGAGERWASTMPITRRQDDAATELRAWVDSVVNHRLADFAKAVGSANAEMLRQIRAEHLEAIAKLHGRIFGLESASAKPRPRTTPGGDRHAR
jgi:hypothetical protein